MRRTAAIAVLLTASVTPAFAQEEERDGLVPIVAAPVEDDEIVVTGTRLKTGDAPALTPVVRSDADDLLRAQPLGIAEALTQLPQFSGSVGARSRQSIAADGRGNFLNLRNVGASRTLILLDGERLPPTTVSGLVDVDVIPELLVKRVDVATSGVSAVYGSDAVTGVVNYILDPEFTGITARAQSGISGRGDAATYKIGAAAGFAALDDRLHVGASLDYADSKGLALADRPLVRRNILAAGLNAAGAPGSAANPYVFAENTRVSIIAPGGRIVTGPFAIVGQQFAPDGRVVAFDPGQFAGQTAQIGGSALAFAPDRSLITGGKSTRAFGHLGYDIADDWTVSVRGLWSRNTASLRTGVNFVTAPIFADNAFLRPETRALLNDPAVLPFGFDPVSAFVCGNGSPAAFCLVRVPSDLSPPNSRLEDTSYTVKARLRGEIGGWSVNAAYIRGRTRQRLDTFNEFINTNLFAALDAVRAPGGQIVCRVTLTNPGLYPGCVPYNPFGAGANDGNRAALEAYLLGTPRVHVVNRTDDLVINASGNAGRTWAGPIRVAVGAEYRDNSLSRTSNADPSVPQVRTGIQGIDPAAPAFVITNAGTANGKASVKEANAEIEVPLAREEAFAHSLSVTGAARITDYSTSGGVTTWKVGGKWEPVLGLLIRAARSRDIRAPTLFDLFAGGTSRRAPLVDAHCNCQPPTGIDVIGGGNPDLEPEIADSLALGFVLRPETVKGFTASVDFYDLKIRDAITVLSPEAIIQACETAGGTGPACAAITRPLPFTDRTPANAATRVFTGAINAAALRTRGLDFDVGYSFEAGGGADVSARLTANRVLRYATQSTAASPAVSQAGVIDHSLVNVVPKWTGKLDLSFRRGGFSANLATRYIDKLKLGLPPGTPGAFAYAKNGLPAVAYIDLGVSQRVQSGRTEFEIFADAHNVLDRDPPVFPGNNLAGLLYPTHLPLYDVVGRYLAVGVRVRR